jgi:hypothetical protein
MNKEGNIVDDLSKAYTRLSTEKKDNLLKAARKLLTIQEGGKVLMKKKGGNVIPSRKEGNL